MNLPECTYRVAYREDSSQFFCRHPRVHVMAGVVDEAICRDCQQRSIAIEGELRAIPGRLPKRTWAGLTTEPLQYISLEQMTADVRQFIGCLPANTAAVAGVPRSGMLPATIIALLLHVPLFELSRKYGLRPLDHGGRLTTEPTDPTGPLVVIDDSVNSGTAMRWAREVAGRCACQFRSKIFAAMYPRPGAAQELDLFYRLAPLPHLFEWNLFNCHQVRYLASDMDGILCEDWPGGDENGAEYQQFLESARPRWLPRRSTLPLIVTARLEHHRPTTMRWLATHRVEVRRLVMGPWTSATERRRSYRAGEFKGAAYKDSTCGLFIESDSRQAREIFETAHKPVLCPATGEVFQDC